jgi:enoyl-CoA hydratase/carnithine racemase
VVLTGDGECFCVDADFADMDSNLEGGRSDRNDFVLVKQALQPKSTRARSVS